MTSPSDRKALSPAKRICFQLLLVVIALLLIPIGLATIEGNASISWALHHAIDQVPANTEDLWSQYDPGLGWICKPHLVLPDFYGRGQGLWTNSSGFREMEDVAARHTKIRVAISGDSFTFGVGVSNQHTFSSLLADRQMEAVNLGQPAYGIDQCYLLFRQNLALLNPDLHIFAIILDDFRRVTESTHGEYPKPILKLTGTGLVVGNVPVPVGWISPLNRRRWAEFRRSLRIVSVAGQMGWTVPERAKAPDPDVWSEGFQISLRVFTELRDLHRARGSGFALVLLPSVEPPGVDLQGFRAKIRPILESSGIVYIDLVPEFEKLPPKEGAAMFLDTTASHMAGAHLSLAGHRWVAGQLRQRLMEGAFRTLIRSRLNHRE